MSDTMLGSENLAMETNNGLHGAHCLAEKRERTCLNKVQGVRGECVRGVFFGAKKQII